MSCNLHNREICLGENKKIAGHKRRYCKKCRAYYSRQFRKRHIKTEAERKKDNCRAYAHVYLKRKKIFKQSCNVCGAIKSEMYHKDYNKPLEIEWLCRKCKVNKYGHRKKN